ncbi:MAG: ThiF family adenylyltransferase [Candidatus Brocadiia bacterium]
MSGQRYIRQEIFEPIGPEGQQRICQGRAVVVGCGALGSNIANALARAGVGHLRIVDRDFVELDNLQRQVLFDEGDAERRMPKAVAAVEHLRRVNSSIRLEARVAELSPANAEALIDGFDVVLDGTDNVEARLLLNDACLKAGRPFVFGGAVASTGMTMAVVPRRTPCFRCLMAELPEPGTAPTAATAGILHATTAVVGALQAVAAVQLLARCFQPSDELLCVDVWERDFSSMSAPRRSDCPACARGRYEYLDQEPARQAERIPGTRSVRVPSAGEVLLDELARSWSGEGEVVANDWLASLSVGDQELVVWADGRAVVKGADSVAAAEELRARYGPGAGEKKDR